MQTINRRQLIRGVAFSGIPVALLGQQGAVPAWFSKLSPAVVQGVRDASVAAHAKLVAGRLTGSDVRSLSIAWGIAFNHLDEIGATSDFENRLKTGGLLDSPLTYAQLTAMRANIATAGVTISDVAFNNLYAEQSPGIAQLRAAISQGGCEGLQASVLSRLHQIADKLDRQQGAPLAAVPATPYLRTVQGCFLVDLSSLYLSVWGYMIVMSVVVVTGPVLVALAAAGVGVAVISLAFC